jgi:hypothetical protein
MPDNQLFERLLEAGRITEQDVALVRADIFADDRDDLDEVDLVFRLAAEWLVEQVGKDGMLHRNEQALLSFIKRNSPDIHPALDPLFQQAELS